MVDAAIDDPAEAALRPAVQAALTLTRKLVDAPAEVCADDITPLLAAGLSPEDVEGVITICTAFATINRIADALEFQVPSRALHERMAPIIYKRGYALP